METVDKTLHMTDSEKYMYNVLNGNLKAVYEKVAKSREELTAELKEFFLGLLTVEIPENLKFTVRPDTYSTDIGFHPVEDKYGRSFALYNRVNNYYTKDREDEYEGFEVSASSFNMKSNAPEKDTILGIKLLSAIFDNMSLVEEKLKDSWERLNKMQDEVNTAASPVDNLIRTANKREDERKREELMSSLVDGVVYMWKDRHDRENFIEVVKLNKKTAEVQEYGSNGYMTNHTMRMKLDVLESLLRQKNATVVDKSIIVNLRKQFA